MLQQGKAIMLSALLLAGGSFAIAQSGGPQKYTPPPPPPPGPQQQQTSEAVSDSHLALYAKASEKVAEIRTELEGEMSSAKTPNEAQVLQNEAMEDMVRAVQSVGMTPEEFNQITALLQSDPALTERYEQMK